MSLDARVREALESHPAVDSVWLAGSRQRGEETALSDWDLAVETTDFEGLGRALPRLVDPLDPLSRQWDRLSPHPTYMLILRGPVKVDLLFLGRVNETRPPWVATAETLPGIDDHFWDWVLWLASKERAGGREKQVAEQRALMHLHLLGPLGAASPPADAGDAVRLYLAARDRAERALRVAVDRALGDEVLSGLRRSGYDVP